MFENAVEDGYADDYEIEVAIQEPGDAMDAANADESTSISISTVTCPLLCD